MIQIQYLIDMEDTVTLIHQTASIIHIVPEILIRQTAQITHMAQDGRSLVIRQRGKLQNS